MRMHVNFVPGTWYSVRWYSGMSPLVGLARGQTPHSRFPSVAAADSRHCFGPPSCCSPCAVYGAVLSAKIGKIAASLQDRAPSRE